MISKHIFKEKHANGLIFWENDFIYDLGFRAIFTQRHGGISPGAYQSLNLGFFTNDHPEHIKVNRQKLLAAAKFQNQLPVIGKQIHSNHFYYAMSKDAGRGWDNPDTAIPECDALITDVLGMPLAITVADCLPLLIFSENPKIALALHVGWRGLCAGIIKHSLEYAAAKWKVSAINYYAVLGPCIHAANFRIKDEAIAQLSAVNPACLKMNQLQTEGSFDIVAAARQQIMGFGIVPDRILIINECTYENPEKYFSYRRDKETGRLMAILEISK